MRSQKSKEWEVQKKEKNQNEEENICACEIKRKKGELLLEIAKTMPKSFLSLLSTCTTNWEMPLSYDDWWMDPWVSLWMLRISSCKKVNVICESNNHVGFIYQL